MRGKRKSENQDHLTPNKAAWLQVVDSSFSLGSEEEEKSTQAKKKTKMKPKSKR